MVVTKDTNENKCEITLKAKLADGVMITYEKTHGDTYNQTSMVGSTEGELFIGDLAIFKSTDSRGPDALPDTDKGEFDRYSIVSMDESSIMLLPSEQNANYEVPTQEAVEAK